MTKRLGLALLGLLIVTAAITGTYSPASAAEGGSATGVSCVWVVPGYGTTMTVGDVAKMKCNWNGTTGSAAAFQVLNDDETPQPAGMNDFRLFFGTVGVYPSFHSYGPIAKATFSIDYSGCDHCMEVTATITTAYGSWPSNVGVGSCTSAGEGPNSFTLSGQSYNSTAVTGLGSDHQCDISDDPDALPPITWGDVWVPEPLVCGTGGESSIDTLTAPRPLVGGYGPVGFPAVFGWMDGVQPVLAGRRTWVHYGDSNDMGDVFVRWVDEPDTAWRKLLPNDDDTEQNLVIERPANMADSTTAGLLFKCVDPNGVLDDLFSFSFQGDGLTNHYQPFLYPPDDALRECASIRIVGIPSTGVIPPGDLDFEVLAQVDTEGVQIRVKGWAGDEGESAFDTGPLDAGDTATLTLDDTTGDISVYDDLLFSCNDGQGWYTIGFGVDWVDGGGGVTTELFPERVDLSKCWTDAGFGLRPSSWLPSAFRAQSCLLRGLFIPTALNTDAVRLQIDNADTGDLAMPLERVAGGFVQLGDMESSCSYSVDLEAGGASVPFSFSSCTGPLAIARTLVSTVSTVMILFFAVTWLKDQSYHLLTLNPNVHAWDRGKDD